VRTCDIWFFSLAFLTQYDDVLFHPFPSKLHNFIFLYSWTILYIHIYMYICIIYSLPIYPFHPLVVVHLGWLHSLSTVNEIKIKWVFRYFFCMLIYIPLDTWNICSIV
jgi:hypothetical protein